MKNTMTRITRLAAALLLGCLATGCVSTFKEVKPLSVGPPPASKPTAVALGHLKITDARLSQPEQALMADAFDLGVKKWCTEHPGLEALGRSASTNLPPRAIMIEGTISEIEKGSSAARFWVGMGAGQQRVLGEFALLSPEGAKLMTFVARKSYLGGQGIGGWDMMKLEDLVSQLGQLVAETADKWLRGEKIN